MIDIKQLFEDDCIKILNKSDVDFTDQLEEMSDLQSEFEDQKSKCINKLIKKRRINK